ARGSIGNSAESSIAVHLRVDDRYKADNQQEKDDQKGVHSLLGLKGIARHRKQKEDKHSCDGRHESAHSHQHAENEVDIDQADELLSQLGFRREMRLFLIMREFAFFVRRDFLLFLRPTLFLHLSLVFQAPLTAQKVEN